MNWDVAPLYGLVDSRRRELALSWPGLLRRCGYANTAKGLRRLNAIWEGDLGGRASVGILSRLAQALDLGDEVVQSALEQSCQQLKYTQRKEEEAAFEPSAYLLGTESRPSQITIFGMTGGAERWLRIPLDLTQPPVTFAGQTLAVVRATPVTPFFGHTTGFVVNYTLDVAVRFDTEGRPLKQLGHAYSPGRVSIGVGGRVIDAGGLEKLLGISAGDSL